MRGRVGQSVLVLRPLVPACCVAALALAWWAALSSTGSTPTGDIARDAAYWLLAVIVPGFAIHRSLRGPADTWIAEISIASCVGLAGEMLAWMLMTAAHINGGLRWWPLVAVVIVAVAAVIDPGLRARVLSRPRQRVHPLAALSVTYAAFVVIDFVRPSYIAAYRMPYAGSRIYPDLLWHMGLSAEAKRSFPLGTPQSITAGNLVYHWYADAHIAAESLITGLGVPELVLRLYVLPLCLLALGMTFTLAHWLSRRQLAAVIAVGLVAVPWSTNWWPGLVRPITTWLALSPSHLFALPLTVFYCYCAAVILRHATSEVGSVPRSAWVMLGIAGFILVGAKASAPPTVFAGAVLALLVTLVWRRGRIPTAIVAAYTAVVFAICQKYISGGSAGANLQLGAYFSLQPVYKRLHSGSYVITSGVLPGLGGRHGVGLWLIAAILVFGVITMVPALSAVVGLSDALRGDIASWLLMGACGGALVPFLVVQQDGYSEAYFLLGVIPLGAVMLGWALAELVGPVRHPSRRALGACLVALAATVGSLGLTDHGREWAAVLHPTRHRVLTETEHMVVLVVLVTILILVGSTVLALWSRRKGYRGLVSLALSAAVVGAIGAQLLAQPLAGSTSRPPRVTLLSTAEAEAAHWIDMHTPASALFATNYHCSRGRQRVACLAMVWWLSGLGQRRVLVESWGYVPGSTYGRPFFDPALLATNQAAYITAAPAALDALTDRGVRYLVVVRGITPISPRLWTETRQVYNNGVIAVAKL